MSTDPQMARVVAELRNVCGLRDNCGCAHAMTGKLGGGCTSNLVHAIREATGSAKAAPPSRAGIAHVFACEMEKGGSIPVVTCVPRMVDGDTVLILSDGVRAMRVRMGSDEAKRLGAFLLAES